MSQHTRFHWSSPFVLVLCLASSNFSQTQPNVRALEPGNRMEGDLVSTNRPKPADKTEELALKLIEAKTYDERRSLLEKEKEFVTAKLTQALLVRARLAAEKGAFGEALAVLHLAQAVAELIGDKLGLAQALSRAGNIYRMQGEYDRALDDLRKALPLHESIGNTTGIFNTLSFITTINAFTGDYDLSLAQRMLALADDSKNKEWLAISLSQMGAQNFGLGKYAYAIDCHQKSLAVYEEINNKPGIAFALHGIGNGYRMYGAYEEALSYFQKSLALSEQIGSTDLSIRTLVNLGALQRTVGNHAQAEEYLRKGINLIETSRIGNFSGNNFWLSLALSNLGEISRLRGDYPQALAYLRKSASFSESAEVNDALAYALGRMAAVMVDQRNFTGALASASRGALIAEQTRGRDAEWRAHVEAGRAYRGLNQSSQARQEFEKAIVLVESIRADVVSSEARSSYFATTQYPYEQYVDLLMEMHRHQPADGYHVLAFDASQRARARSLLEVLVEARVDIRQGVDSELLGHERTLKRQLNVAAARQSRLLTARHSEKQISAAKMDVDELTMQLQHLRSQIRLKSPRYAELTHPVPLKLGQIQKDLLDPDTALLEYKLGEERSFLWVVTSNSINSLELPKRADLKKSVRLAVTLLSDAQRWATNDLKLKTEYAQAVDGLSSILLPPALFSKLPVRRLVVVSDGALQYLPFAALVSPKLRVSSSTDRRNPHIGFVRPLIADYELVGLPSASTLAVLRRESSNRVPAAKSVAVLADAVFEVTDERVTKQQVKAEGMVTNLRDISTSRTVLEQAIRSNSRQPQVGLGIARLPFSRFEANAILESANLGESFRATDFRASRETATGSELAKYRYVHFATHGILNSEHPELSGVVLSLVDEQGKPVDGFLRLHDIYNLNSAC